MNAPSQEARRLVHSSRRQRPGVPFPFLDERVGKMSASQKTETEGVTKRPSDRKWWVNNRETERAGPVGVRQKLQPC